MSLAREDSSAREIFSDLFVVIAYQQWHDSIRKISYNIRPYVLSNLDWDHTLWSQFNRRRTFLKLVTYFFSDWETPLVLAAQNWQLISLTFLTVYISSHCCVSILAALGASLHTSVLAEHRLTTECYEPGQLRLSLPVHSCLTAHCRWSTVAYTHGVSWHPHSFQIHDPVQTTFVYLFVREGLKIGGDTRCCFYTYLLSFFWHSLQLPIQL